jgi:hypothetical protein
MFLLNMSPQKLATNTSAASTNERQPMQIPSNAKSDSYVADISAKLNFYPPNIGGLCVF